MSNIDIMKKGLHAWETADEATLSQFVADDFQLSGPVPAWRPIAAAIITISGGAER